jgi:TonB family protein
MLLDQKSELQLRATRPKPLVMSILVHFLLILILAFNPGWFETTHRRVVRIAGEDFDLSKLELRQLTLPPRMPRALPAPAPVPPPAAQTPPLVQQLPQQAAPPPPPPPPPPPTPPPPDRVIRPDDVLAEGARPDGSPRASRGDTREQARSGGPSQKEGQSEAQDQETKEAQKAQEGRQSQLASNAPNKALPNLNRDALQVPGGSLASSLDKIVEARLANSATRGGGRTGLARADNNGSYSTTDPQILSPNPKGIDFGPYLNQLLNRLRSNWYSVMPEIARLGQQGRVDIIFSITRNGNVKDLQVIANSGYDALDRGAVSAIQISNPFSHLPLEYETDLKLRIAFLYNMNP